MATTDNGAAGHNGDAHHGPLDQFAINRYVEIDLGGFDASFTNSALMMCVTVIVITLLTTVGMGRGRLVPGRMQSIVEMSYEMIARMLGDIVGGRGAQKFFPFVFSLFMFLLLGNVLGLIPYSFTFTSHIIVTLAFALVVFVGVTILAIVIHKHRFLTFFLPPGVPMWMAPLLVPIEVVSYMARPISLSVRLFANMMAGHSILHVFGAFVFVLSFAGVLPFAFIVALYGLELLVAVLQAYVFTILTCLYIRDAIELHH
ncbi:MAG: F0F1 ATP synthase subunit A [Rhodospirillaceae bacterium]|nr:F0F1 ATP synthase subunit A [Rhodospirillaceae bacterium]